jgi:hypothetical protein
MKQCQCNHDPYWLYKEIKGARYPQKFREVDGKYELFCEVCGGLWDHRATDRLIDLVMSGAFIPRLPSAQAAEREGRVETAPNESRVGAARRR